MRADAASFGASWRALVIGVDDAGDTSFARLAAAEREARKLAAVLIDPAGTGVPAAQVACLTGATATRGEILAALDRTLAGAGPDNAVLLYFGGHGILRGEGFYLCAAGTSCDNLADTAIGSADLDRRLGELAVRGVLLVLDCCSSAALAENAPETFRSLRRGEYRILLSAARANQEAWELDSPAGSGTLFSKVLIDIVGGRIAAGAQPGVVYFTDLMREFHDRIAELRETVAPQAPAQEILYTGAFSKDPLLFVHRGLSLRQIALETARYSPAFVRRRIRRILVAAAGALFFATTVYYALLQHTEYAAIDGDKIAVFQGYPGINGPGFPVRLWTLDYGPERLLPGPRGMAPLPILAPLSRPVLPLIEMRQRPELRAGELLDAGDNAGARRLALSVLADPHASFESRLFAEMGLAYAAQAEDVPKLTAMLRADRRDVHRPAIAALAHLDPRSVFPLLAADLPQGVLWPHADVVHDIEAPCPPQQAAYLAAVMAIDSNVPSPAEVLDAALRANCSLPLSALVAAVRRPEIEGGSRIAGYARHAGIEAPLRDALASLIGDVRENVFTREQAIGAYMLLPGATCLPTLAPYLRNRFDYVALQAARAMGHLCPGYELHATWQPEHLAISTELTRDSVPIWSLEVRSGQKGQVLLLKQLLAETLTLSDRHFDEALLNFATTTEDDSAREQALIALEIRGATARVPPVLLDSNNLGVRRATYELERLRDPVATGARLLGRIGRQDMFYVEMLGRTHLPVTTLTRLGAQLDADADQRRDASCVLAMQASVPVAAALAARPEADIRRQAADCIPFHHDAGAIVEQLGDQKNRRFPIETIHRLRRDVARKIRLERELAALPSAEDRLWRLSLIESEMGAGLSAGMRYWIHEQRFLLRLELARRRQPVEVAHPSAGLRGRHPQAALRE